jgi:hypothetical protein
MEDNMHLILTVELIAGLLFLAVVGLSKIEDELIQRPRRSLLVDPERERRSGRYAAAPNGVFCLPLQRRARQIAGVSPTTLRKQ